MTTKSEKKTGRGERTIKASVEGTIEASVEGTIEAKKEEGKPVVGRSRKKTNDRGIDDRKKRKEITGVGGRSGVAQQQARVTISALGGRPIAQQQCPLATNTRAVSLKEETKEPNQGGGSTGFRDPAKQARERKLDGSVERAAKNDVSQKIEPEVFCGETDWKEQIAKSICPEGTDCKEHLPARTKKSKDMRTPNRERSKDPIRKREH
eukprot:jgi/Psemu1/40657/gm1.40657_g